MAAKTKKPHAAVRISRDNLKDLIRDELYGAALGYEISIDGQLVLCLPYEDVPGIVKKIAKRAAIGP